MRPNFDDYFMSIAYLVSTRATCDRKKVGSVIVKNRRIVSTGYNGAPAGMPDCSMVGHELRKIDEKDSCIRSLHSESNAIDFAGKECSGSILYTTVIPCYDCAKRIINAGISRVIYAEFYASRNTELVEEYFHRSLGCRLDRWNGELVLPTNVPEDILNRTAIIQRGRE